VELLTVTICPTVAELIAEIPTAETVLSILAKLAMLDLLTPTFPTSAEPIASCLSAVTELWTI
jgi:hypothetical protein